MNPAIESELWKSSCIRARLERDSCRRQLLAWRVAAVLLAVALVIVATLV